MSTEAHLLSDLPPTPRPGAATGMPPRQINEFLIEGVLGQGASSVVYLARQSRPARRVALKLHLGPMLSGENLFRFEREAGLMGSIEHPHIARLYGTGIFREMGFDHPYLVMERIEGLPLTEHAEQQRLDLRARVRLLAQLAHAIHFVHTRGVIHRDLKPANILVDRDGVPKILDFGVARAVALEQSEPHTMQGQLIGTLPYMAPEQLLGDPRQVDLQADVYALGMIGFELLSGRLPYHPEAFRTVITADQTLRQNPPERQANLLAVPQDLQRVMAKAVHGSRAVRYGSALELAMDLDRFLAYEPVLARPPSPLHSLALFAQRRRTLAGALGFSLLSLVTAIALSAHFALAERAAHLREESAHAKAETRAAELDATNGLLVDILAGADPGNGDGPALSVQEVLHRARRRLHDQPPDNPAVAIRFGMAIGDTLVNLHDSEAGLAIISEAAERARKTPGLDPQLRNEMLYDEAATLLSVDFSGRTERRLRELLAVPGEGGNDNHQLWIDIRLGLAQTLMQVGRPVEAIPFMDSAEAAIQQWPDQRAHGTQYVRMSRLSLDYLLGHYDALLAMQAREDATLAAAGNSAEVIRENLTHMAALSARDLGRIALAENLAAARVQQAQAIYGEAAPNVLEAKSDRTYLHALLHPQDAQARLALRQLRQALARKATTEPLLLVQTQVNEAAIELRQGVADRAEAGARTLQDILRQTAQGSLPANSTTVRAALVLAHHQATHGQPAQAQALYRTLCHPLQQNLPADHPLRLRCEAGLAGNLASAEQF